MTVVSFQNGVYPTIAYAGCKDADILGNPADSTDAVHAPTNHNETNYGDYVEDDVHCIKYDEQDNTNGGHPHMVLLRFDDIIGSGYEQIPTGAIIDSAILSLWIYDVGSGTAGDVHDAYVVWVDTDVTYNSYPNGEPPPAAPRDYSTLPVSAITEIVATTGPSTADVTTSVQDWVDGVRENYGWIIIPKSTDGRRCYSGHHFIQTVTPKLTVTYHRMVEMVNDTVSITEGALPDTTYEVTHYVISPYGNGVSKPKVPMNLNNWSVTNNGGTIWYVPYATADAEYSGVRWDPVRGVVWAVSDTTNNYRLVGITPSQYASPPTAPAYNLTAPTVTDCEGLTFVDLGGDYIWFVHENAATGNASTLSEYRISTAAMTQTGRGPLIGGGGFPTAEKMESLEWMPSAAAEVAGLGAGYMLAGGQDGGGTSRNGGIWIYTIDVNNHSTASPVYKTSFATDSGDACGIYYDRSARVLYVVHGTDGTDGLVEVLTMDPDFRGNGFQGLQIDTFYVADAAIEGITFDPVARRIFVCRDVNDVGGWVMQATYDPHGTVQSSGMFTAGLHTVTAVPDPGYRVKQWRIRRQGETGWTIPSTTDSVLSIPDLTSDAIVTVEFTAGTSWVEMVNDSIILSESLLPGAAYEVVHYAKGPYGDGVSRPKVTRVAGAYPAGTVIKADTLLECSDVKWNATEAALYYHGDGTASDPNIRRVTNLGADTAAPTSWLAYHGYDTEGITWVTDTTDYFWILREDQTYDTNDALCEIEKSTDTEKREINLNSIIPAGTHFEAVEWVPGTSGSYGGYFWCGDQGNGKICIIQIDVNDHASVAKTLVTPAFWCENYGSQIQGMWYDRNARLIYIWYGDTDTVSICWADPDRKGTGLIGREIDKFNIVNEAVPYVEGFCIDTTNQLLFINDDGASYGNIHRFPYDPHGTVNVSGVFPGGTGYSHTVIAVPDPGYRVNDWKIGVLRAGTISWTTQTPATHADTFTVSDLAEPCIVMVDFVAGDLIGKDATTVTITEGLVRPLGRNRMMDDAITGTEGIVTASEFIREMPDILTVSESIERVKIEPPSSAPYPFYLKLPDGTWINVAGDVRGPGTVVDGNVSLWHGTTGMLLSDGEVAGATLKNRFDSAPFFAVAMPVAIE